MNGKVDIMQDDSEIMHYDTPGIPLYIRKGVLSYYADMRADCHWHEDIELIYILDGEMRYYLNGKIILLKEGDGLIVNSKVMHYGFSHAKMECSFLCILFHPSLLQSCQTISQKYVSPLLSRSVWEFFVLSPSEHSTALAYIQKLWQLKEEASGGYELGAIGILFSLWQEVLLLAETSRTDTAGRMTDPGLELFRSLVSYIHMHYQENFSLSGLCRYAGIGKSTCCALFRANTSLSPIAFVNQYRLKVAAGLLSSTDLSVIEIAMQCGFNHHSYFTKLFHKTFGYTPREYRANVKRE